MSDAPTRFVLALALLAAAGCASPAATGTGDAPIRLTPMSAEEAGAITVSFRFPDQATYRLAVIPFDMASVRVTLTSPRLTSDRTATYNVSGAPSDTTFTKLRPGDYQVSAHAYTGTDGTGANVALATSRTITVTGGGTPQAVVLKMHLAPFNGKVQ